MTDIRIIFIRIIFNNTRLLKMQVEIWQELIFEKTIRYI